MINLTSRYIAIAILGAVKLWSDSFDQAGADAAAIAEQLKREEWERNQPGRLYPGYGTDFKQFYTKTLEECCHEACAQKDGPGISNGRLIYLALDGWWNDTIDWANQVLDPTGTTEFSLEQCQHGVPYPKPVDVEAEEKPLEKDDWHCKLCKEHWARCKAENDKTEL